MALILVKALFVRWKHKGGLLGEISLKGLLLGIARIALPILKYELPGY